MATKADSAALERLFTVVAARRGGDPESSYTAKLLAGGPKLIARKLGEEAIETVIAALAGERGAVIAESADLIYHLAVLWAATGVAPSDIWAELASREGVSGIEEKRTRS